MPFGDSFWRPERSTFVDIKVDPTENHGRKKDHCSLLQTGNRRPGNMRLEKASVADIHELGESLLRILQTTNASTERVWTLPGGNLLL